MVRRTSAVQLASSLWIKGDPLTGRRELSMNRLAAIAGVSASHLRHVKIEDDWKGEAERYANESRLGPSWNSSNLVEEIDEIRLVLSEKKAEALEKVRDLKVDDPKFPETFDLFTRVEKHWARVTGVDSLLAADGVRKTELARLQARSEVDQRKKENELEEDMSGKIVAV